MASTTIEHDDLTIESSHETEAAMREAVTPDEPAAPGGPAPVSDTAEPTPPGATVVPAADKSRNRRDDPNRAVQTAVAKQRDAERIAAEQKARADRLEADLARAQASAAVAAPVPAPRAAAATPAPAPTAAEWRRYVALPDAPKFDQFDNNDDYVAAMSLFIADTRFDERMDRIEQSNFERQRATTWHERLTAARAADPSFDTRVDPTTPATQQMRDYITDSSVGPDLLLHLSAHRDDAQRISTLPPPLVEREMGKLEGQILARATAASPGPASTPVISSAKRVTKPVTSSPVGSDDVDEADLPVEEFIRRANARDRADSAARR